MQPNCEGPSELDFGAQTLSRAPGVSDGQGGLACCDSWGRKESDMTERLNGTQLNMNTSATTGSVFSSTTDL